VESGAGESVRGGDIKAGAGPMTEGEAAADVIEADTVAGVWVKAGARVRDGNGEGGGRDFGGNADEAATGLGGDAVFDGIFDERFEGENGDAEGEGGGIDGEFGAEVAAEAKLFDFEVSADDGEFLLERDEGVVVAEEVAKDVGEVEDGLACALSIGGDDAVEGIEGVEEEVGVDLGLEGAEFGLGEEAGAFGLAGMLEAFGNELGELGEFSEVF
jgi:hypothetical protein